MLVLGRPIGLPLPSLAGPAKPSLICLLFTVHCMLSSIYLDLMFYRDSNYLFLPFCLHLMSWRS